MNGHEVTMLAVNAGPFISVLNILNKIVAKGFEHEFVELLSRALNFTIYFTRCGSNATVADLSRSLENGETDMSSMTLSVRLRGQKSTGGRSNGI